MLQALWVSVIPTIAAVAAKCHESLLADASLSWPQLVRLSCPDLMYGALATCVCLIAVEQFGPRGRSRLLLAAHVLALVACVLVIADDGYFVITGTRLNGSMLAFGITHLLEQHHVIAAHIPDKVYVAWVALPLAIGLPALLSRIAPQRALWRYRPLGNLGSAVLYGGIATACITAVLISRTVRELPPAAAEFDAPILAGLAAGMVSAPPTVAAPVPFVRPTITPTPQLQRKNVIIVVLESTRAVSTTPYAPTLATTPFLAGLAREGTLVEHAYTTIPRTTKSLVPIHCGMWPKLDLAGVEALDTGIPTDCLPAVLRRNGWATAMLQSVDEGYDCGPHYPRNFGFSHFAGVEHLPTAGFDRCSYFGYEDDILLQPALQWIDRQTTPFLLTLATVVPHDPYTVPKGFARTDFGTARDELTSNYLNCIHYTDRFLSKLVAGLRQRKLMDHTVLVVIGDHGELLGEHRANGHGDALWDEALRVPLVLYGAGVPAGRVVTGLRQNIDVMPTLLELLRFAVQPGDLPGRSLLAAPGHDQLIFSANARRHQMALLTADRKTLWFYDRRPAASYARLTDPTEQRDLGPTAQTAADIALLQTTKARIDGWYDAHERQGWRQFVRPSTARADRGVFLLDLLAWPQRAEPGDLVEVTADYSIGSAVDALPAVTLTHASGAQLPTDHEPAVPLDQWLPGTQVRDRFLAQVPREALPGLYRLAVALPGKLQVAAGTVEVVAVR